MLICSPTHNISYDIVPKIYITGLINLRLRTLSRYIQSTCATSGEGLYEGLDWLSNNIAGKVKCHKQQFNFVYQYFQANCHSFFCVLVTGCAGVEGKFVAELIC